MKKTVFIMVILICFTGSLILSGCELVSVNEARDLNQVVAKVGDVSLLKKVYKNNYRSYLYSQGLSEEDVEKGSSDPSMAFQLALLPSQILDSMVRAEIYRQKAIELGLDKQITEDEQKQIDDDYNSLMNYYSTTLVDSKKEQYKDEADGEERAKREALEEYNEYLDSLGLESTEAYKEYLKNQVLTQKLVDYYDAKVSVTDDEIKSWYDTQMTSQKSKYDATPADYETDLNNSDVVIVYRPDGGFRRVKHVLIEFDQADQDAINAETDEDKKAELVKEAHEKIKPKAEEVLKKIKDGADFSAMIDEYSSDPGMEKEQPAYEEGYLVSADNTSFVAPFKEAAMALKGVGDISDLVETDFGYHIIQYFKDEPVGEVPFETVKDQCKEKKLAERQSEEMEKLYSDWYKEMSDEGKIVLYSDRLKTPKVPGK